LLLREAPRLNYGAEFARELTEDWDEGAGLASAGVTLLAWQLQNSPPCRRNHLDANSGAR
jgi:hypothetical protein